MNWIPLRMVGLFLLLAAATAIAQVPAAAEPQSQASATASLVIGAGDLIEVAVFDTPELGGKVRVSNTGLISLPLIGAAKIAGLTTEDAAGLIRTKLMEGGYVKDPHVSVLIGDFATQGVSVFGEVKKPGIYPVLGPRRLLDVLSAAEGLTEAAGRTVTISRRDHAEPAEVVTLTSGAATNPMVLPGDTVVVQKAGIAYVVGDVARPGGFLMQNQEQLTVLQAIALAQGTNRSARIAAAKLFRQTPEGRQEVSLNLKRILDGKDIDQPLQDQDIIFVPTSVFRAAGKRGLEAALQATVGVIIYRR